MQGMIIDLRRLGDEPEELTLTFSAAWLATALVDVVHEDSEASGEARLTVSLMGDKVQVMGQVQARFAVACGRCLEPTPVAMDEPFAMFFEESQPDSPPEELELAEDDLNWESYDGEQIDLEPLLREQLLLAVPMMPRCRADCPGLDNPHAPREEDEGGQDGEKNIDPRWKALEKLKPTR